MSRSYELGMTLDYVSDWVLVDAIREFFRNCLDESIQNEENKWFCKYDKESKLLQIGNRDSTLSPKTLLLGSSSKRGDSSTLGEHGEGYKVATIVLMRTGHTLRILNYNNKEVWEARVVKSRRYETEIVKFEVDSLGFRKAPDNNLVFEIGNITEDEFSQIVDHNLWLKDDVGVSYKGSTGSVLLNSKEKGRIYVNGLFVKTVESLAFGYDFTPGVIKLDRDRHTLDTWDLKWSTSKLIASLKPDEINVVKSAPEACFLHQYAYQISNSDRVAVCNDSYNKFKEANGDSAIPVLTDREFNDYAKRGYTCVKLPSNEYELVTGSPLYKKVELPEKSLSELLVELNSWYNNVKSYISPEARKDGSSIMDELKRFVVDEN